MPFTWLRAIQRDKVLESEDQVGEYLALLGSGHRDELDRQIEALALEPSYKKLWKGCPCCLPWASIPMVRGARATYDA